MIPVDADGEHMVARANRRHPACGLFKRKFNKHLTYIDIKMGYSGSYSLLRFSPMGKVADVLVSLIGRMPVKTAFLLAWLSTWIVPAFAVGDGSTGLIQVTQMMSSYLGPAVKPIYAADALCGLIGAIKIYSKFSSGDPDTGKVAGNWFGICVSLIVAATVLKAFFL